MVLVSPKEGSALYTPTMPGLNPPGTGTSACRWGNTVKIPLTTCVVGLYSSLSSGIVTWFASYPAFLSHFVKLA